jgi:phosphoribosylglycinamide formyltransferase-1
MISGGGRTALNLLDAVRRGELHARIALVISSDEGAPGVARCRERGLTVIAMPGVIPARTLGATLTAHDIDAVALCGYLKLLRVPESYRGRIVNIHPALLPKFGGKGMHGLHVHAAVLEAGEPESGCTVHLVDDTYDTGPILLQRRCPVLPGDTPESLAARVFGHECLAYPRAIGSLLSRLPPARATEPR